MVLEQVAGMGRGVTSLLEHLHVPSAATDARDLQLLRALPRPDEAAIAWANLLSDHGATDMWVQLARGLGERSGADQALFATNLLRETRDAGRLARDEAKQLARPRPFQRGFADIVTCVHEPITNSFPSGHTLSAHSNARVMATIDPANASTYWWLANQEGGARIVGRVHHPSDVAVGADIGVAVAGDVLESHGLTPAAAPSTSQFFDERAWLRFGNDADAAARVVALMPSDVRAAGAASTRGDGPLHAWFGARAYDNHLRF
jgi:hypothetical protein